MAASLNVSQLSTCGKSPIPKSGVLTIRGFGIRVRVHSGHLEIEDGIGPERRKIRLARVGHGLKRLVCIGNDGFVTLDALQWVSDIDASFVMLDRGGKVLFVTGPTASNDARLRRAQSLALGNGTALRISKDLISRKLVSQAALVRDLLHNDNIAESIVGIGAKLQTAEDIETVMLIEAQAAKLYWQTWSGLPIRWPRNDERRVPEHWKQFKARISPLTGSPRLAADPANSILNLLYSILEAESRLSAVAMGLDPGIGFLHADAKARDSLACDLQEPVRASVDAFVVNWLQSEPLRRADFFEDSNGNCRLTSALAIKLCETANTWRRLVAPIAEYVAKEIWNSIPKPKSMAGQQIATRLTQRNKREVKGSEVPSVSQPRPEHICGSCGAKIRSDNKNCSQCWKQQSVTVFNVGRELAQEPEAIAKRSDTMLKHRQQIRDWKVSDMPQWLTRDVYMKEIQPALSRLTKSQIRSALGVSKPYTMYIQSGERIPHQRHWRALAELVGLSR